MGLFDEHPDTVDCSDWAEPHIPLGLKPRIEVTGATFRVAARDIIEGHGLKFASYLLTVPNTDPRLLPFLRDAIARESRRLNHEVH